MSVDVSFLGGQRLEVYSTEWCPDCRRLKSWLDQAGVEHAEVDIDSVAGAAEKLESETGKKAVPFILVNGETWVRGYHKEAPMRFSGEMLVAELAQALR